MSVPLVDRQMPSSMQSTATRPDTSNHSDLAKTLCIPKRRHVILTKGKDQWACARGSRLENSLGWAVGLLEFANAGDFAANIFNDVPVPLHAVILRLSAAPSPGSCAFLPLLMLPGPGIMSNSSRTSGRSFEKSSTGSRNMSSPSSQWMS
jgi:hypothetical protein